ncbi:LppA family lipoprotein [Amycolatopsis keratiniphila]|uniref:LppA family lipoprotein n=1 Tax=Amycolatopsis keratiniphila TaxID=129921 RepID=UPI0009F99DFE|nr:LppA family lipoprotein [Amycolatopsis keratiniphila]
MKHAAQTTSWIAGMAVAVLLTSTACDSSPDYLDNDHSKDGMSTQQQFADLLKRPDAKQAQAKYDEALTDLRAKLTEATGFSAWQQGTVAEVAPGCNAFRAVDVHDVYTTYTTWGLPEVIPEASWAKTTQALTEAAGKHGFTKKGFEVNQPAFQELHLLDDFGADLTLSTSTGTTTGTSTMLTLKTGCHLSAEAHKRGTPRPAK